MNNNGTITELENLKRELLERVEHIDKTISTLRSMSFSSNGHSNSNSSAPETSGKYSDYDKNATVRNKVVYVLKKENRFLKVREIAEILHSLEPNTSVKEFQDSKLSAPITYLKTQGTIVKTVVGKGHINTFWGSKNWIDENGNIKPEHRYDESQLILSGGEEIEI